MAPSVQQREPQATPAILTGRTVNQWPRSYLVHLAGDPLMALLKDESKSTKYMPKI